MGLRKWTLNVLNPVLLGMCLLLPYLDSAVAKGQRRCDVDHFEPRHKECRPCSVCGPREVTVRPCSATRDTECSPLEAARSSSLLIDCTETLGLYFEGNSALDDFKRKKKSPVEKHRWLKLKTASCKLVKKYSKKVLKRKHYSNRNCPGKNQFFWENSPKILTCYVCRQCPAGSLVIRSCGGRQDTACSFPPVPKSVELFSFTCSSTKTHVRAYSRKPHQVSEMAHHIVQGKLCRPLCTLLEKTIEKASDRTGFKTTKFASSTTIITTTTTTVTTTTAAAAATTTAETTATSTTATFSADEVGSNDSSSCITHREGPVTDAVEEEADTEDNEGSAPGHGLKLLIIVSSLGALAVVCLLTLILSLTRRLKIQSKRIKRERAIIRACPNVYCAQPPFVSMSPPSKHIMEETVRAIPESKLTSVSSTLHACKEGYESEASSTYENVPTHRLPAADVTEISSFQKRRGFQYLHFVRDSGVSSQSGSARTSASQEIDNKRDFLRRSTNDNVYCSMMGQNSRPVKLEESSRENEQYLDGSSCVERLTSFRPIENPHIVNICNVNCSDAAKHSRLLTSSDDDDDYGDKSSTTRWVALAVERHAPSTRPHNSQEDARRSGSSLTDVSELDDDRIARERDRNVSTDSDFSSASDDSPDGILGIHSFRDSVVSSSSRSTSVSLEINLPLNNEMKLAAFSPDWLQKTTDVPPVNFLTTWSASATTQTEDKSENLECPIFSSWWQEKKNFSSAGGTFCITQSDVRLEIPTNAVPPTTYVDISGATYTNLAHVRAILNMSSDEVIMSPTAEFHAGAGFRFAKPVQLYLPNSLPPSFPEKHIKVYHFHREENGELIIKFLPTKAAYEKQYEDRNFGTESDADDVVDDASLEDFPGFFELLPSGELRVTTTQFCGYTCSACGQEVDKVPQVHLLATGSHRQVAESSWQIYIRLALWDRKINIADFQRDYLAGEKPVAEKTMNTVDDFQESLVKLQLAVSGPNEDSWRHALRSNSQDPIFEVVKHFMLKELLHCQAKDAPRFEEWLIENIPGRTPGPVFQCYIDVENLSPDEQDEGAASAERGSKKVTLFVQGVKKVISDYDEWAGLARAGNSLTPKRDSSAPTTNARTLQATRQQNTSNAGATAGPGSRPQGNPPTSTRPGFAATREGAARIPAVPYSSDSVDERLLFGDGGGGQNPGDGHPDPTPGTSSGNNELVNQPSPTNDTRGQTRAVALTAISGPDRHATQVSGFVLSENSEPGSPLLAGIQGSRNNREFWENVHPEALMHNLPADGWRQETRQFAENSVDVDGQGRRPPPYQ